MIDDPAPRPQESSRRDLLKKGAAGAAVAWVAPTVLSVQGAAAQSAGGGGGIQPTDPTDSVYLYTGPAPFFPLTYNQFQAAVSPRPFSGPNATLPGSYTGIALMYIAGNTVMPSPAEMAAMLAYIQGGGRVLLDSDYSSFPTLNNTASAILAGLGASMSYVPASLDGGCGTTTANVVPGPFSTGLGGGGPVSFASTGDIAVAGPAAVILNGNVGQPLIAYQQIGAGVVFYTSDTQTFDDICGPWASGNSQLVANILS